jgi:hypothetical protein
MSYGHWELRIDADGRAKLLPGGLPFRNARHETMPMIIAVFPWASLTEKRKNQTAGFVLNAGVVRVRWGYQ